MKRIYLRKVAVVFIAFATFMMMASLLAVFVMAPIHQKWQEYQYEQNNKRIYKVQRDMDQIDHILSNLNKLYREQKLP
jgi:hypothetical protein